MMIASWPCLTGRRQIEGLGHWRGNRRGGRRSGGGIGQGLAIPHGKSDVLKDMAMAIGKPAEPIDFESVDGKPVRLVVLLASRPDQVSDHIQALAKISRLHMEAEFREKIYAAQTPEEIYELLQKHASA